MRATTVVRPLTLVLPLLLAAVLGGCPDATPTEFACTAQAECPTGYCCGIGGFCAPEGDSACEPGLDAGEGNDAGLDAGTAVGFDAGFGERDAGSGSDAGPDAGVDAGADAGIDAGIPDAGPNETDAGPATDAGEPDAGPSDDAGSIAGTDAGTDAGSGEADAGQGNDAGEAQAPTDLTYSANPAVYTRGQLITADTPTTSDGEPTSYEISPPPPVGLSFSTMTGILSGTPSALSGPTAYTVAAFNAAGSTSTILNITVNDVAPSGLTYATNPAVYTKGQPITSDVPHASGGGPVISWAISPSVPAGLNFSTTTGLLSGTPTVLSSATAYTVTATNSGGSTTAVLLITVNDIPPTGLTYSTNPAIYPQGETIPINTPSSSGGAVLFYAVAPALPAGLSLSTPTGIISGAPTALVAATPYTVTATNSGGSATISIIITVNDAAWVTYAMNPAIYPEGEPIQANIPSSGGSIVSYAIMPTLPEGLAFDMATGIVSGTPTMPTATTTYTVTATNSVGSTTAMVTITVVGETSTTCNAESDTKCTAGQICDLNGVCAITAYTINGDGTVTDDWTGLVWQQGTRDGYSWSGTSPPASGSAQAYCESLSLSGRAWTLPAVNQLFSLVNVATVPTINQNAFPDTQDAVLEFYWSSTLNTSTNPWNVTFLTGNVGSGFGELYSSYVRCVASG